MIRLVFLSVVLFGAACACGSQEAAVTPTPTALATATVGGITPTQSTAAPSATPTAPPTIAPTPTSTATPGVATPVAGTVVEHGDRSSTMVALTFDMGGRVDPALDIMNWLVDNGVAATVFMTGAMVENANTDAGREVLGIIDAHPAQFALGNHSYSHPDFRDLTNEEMRAELVTTEKAIARFTSVGPRPFFRPPFGGQNTDVIRAAAQAGYSRTVLWDVDTIDWEPEADGGPTTDGIVAKVLANARGGSIVLMHLGGYHTFEALPAIVAGLRANGLTPVTLRTLLGE